MADTTIWTRFLELPRALQWAAYAGVTLLLFAVYWNFVEPHVIAYNQQADAMIDTIERANRDSARSELDGRTRATVVAFGVVDMPTDRMSTTEALADVVNAIMADAGVKQFEWDSKQASKLKKGTLDDIADRRVAERITGDLRFEATPEVAMRIIAALESSSEVEAVSTLKIDRMAGRVEKVQVRLAVEAWALSKPRARS